MDSAMRVQTMSNKDTPGALFVVSAPSGAGKTTLVNGVVSRLGEVCSLARVVTYTTKKPRQGEDRPGVDYHFVSNAEFEDKIAQGFFLEWSGAYGHYYGSPLSALHEVATGASRILILDRRGAQQVKAKHADAVLVWVYTKDLMVLKERLHHRGTDSMDQIVRRLALAEQEIEQELLAPLFDYHILNDSFGSALSEFEHVVKKALDVRKSPL